MTEHCPSSAELGRLLEADPDDASVLGSARHVEQCLACQKELERLTAAANPVESTGAAARPHAPTEAFIRRVKALGQSHASGTGRGTGPPEPGAPSLPVLPAIPGYDILGEIGRGGMGVVYKARHLGLNRVVALKMILADAHAGPRERARFRTEAEAVARLHHAHLVQVYDAGEAEGRPYLTLEYVEGKSLKQLLDGTPLPAATAAHLVETLARTMHYAHTQGVVHRDLKPGNVLMAVEGGGWRVEGERQPSSTLHPPPSTLHPKITDFGLAKQLDVDSGQTGTGDILGTPSYMAPEQVGGSGQGVGPAADVYALGAILYEMLTGRPPFRAATPLETLVLVLHEEPVSVTRLHPGLPRDVETVCLKCLEKDPRRRYAGALALAEDLRRLQAGEPIQARTPSLPERWVKFARRNRALVSGAAAVLAALFLGLVSTLIFAVGEARQRGLAEEGSRLATERARQIEHENYQTRLAACQSALREHDTHEATRHLLAAPVALRGWEWHHLQARLDDSLAAVPVAATAAFGPPGHGVLTTHDDVIGLFDAFGGARRRTFGPAAGCELFAAETTRGLLLAVATGGRLRLLDEAGTPRLTLDDLDRARVRVLAVSPDGSLLALFQNQREGIRLYEIATGKRRAVLRRHDGMVIGMAFSPDGRRLASAGEDHRLYTWDTARGDSMVALVGHTNTVRWVTYSPDAHRILSAADDGTFRQWDATTGKVVDLRTGPGEPVLTAAYSPDGKWIASGGPGGAISLWSAAGGPPVAALLGHTASVTRLAYSADGSYLASTSNDGTARVWDATRHGDPRVLRDHTRYVYPVAYSPDGRWFASAGWDDVIRLWDAASGAPGAVLAGHSLWVGAIAISPDGRRLFSHGFDRMLRAWDTHTGRQLWVRDQGGIEAHGWVSSLVVSPDGAVLGCGDENQVLRRDPETGDARPPLIVPLTHVRLLAYRPDGRVLAVAGDEPDILLLDAASGAVRHRLQGHTATVQSLAFSPDGRRLVSAGTDGTVRLWDADAGTAHAVLEGHGTEVFAAVFHPDGTRLASGGRDRVIRIWDGASGAELVQLPGHTSYVFSLAFSPDGRTLVSGSGDYTVRLWDTFPLAERIKARRTLGAVGK